MCPGLGGCRQTYQRLWLGSHGSQGLDAVYSDPACPGSLARAHSGWKRQSLKAEASTSGSHWLRLSGFLFAEPFISGVGEAQGSFLHRQ